MHFVYFLLPLPVFCGHAHKRPIYSNHFGNATAVPQPSYIGSAPSDAPLFPSFTSKHHHSKTKHPKHFVRAEPTSSVLPSVEVPPSAVPMTVDFQVLTITIGDESSSSQASSTGTSSASASSTKSLASASTASSAVTSKPTAPTATTMSKVTSKSTQASSSSSASKSQSKATAKPKATSKPKGKGSWF
ncbi:hypothetical protein F5Y04DRAFT_275005 [Hypomontagnella monticulosa]|nr:hypothetical protein F5Y04DRAFT_275005 [Hypomontagnella monticulosa]